MPLPQQALQFEELLAPIPVDEFIAKYWGRKPLHRRAGSAVAELVSSGDIDRLVVLSPDHKGRAGAYCVRTDPAGETSEYPLTDPSTPAGMRSARRARQAFDQGYTIVLNRLHRSHAAISNLCLDVEHVLQHRVGCNLYLSPANAQGFAPHRDGHDALVVQLRGSKQWQIWDPVADVEYGEARRADQTVTLSEGEILYLPQGWRHAATAGTESMHVTLGIQRVTWAQLLSEVADRSPLVDARLTSSIPSTLPVEGAQAALVVAELLRGLADEVESSEIVTNVLRDRHLELLRRQPPDIGHRVLAGSRRPITLEDRVMRRRGLVPLVQEVDDVVTLSFAGGSVTAGREAGAAFSYLCEVTELIVSKLPGLADESKLALVNGLIDEGFLEVGSSPAVSGSAELCEVLS